MYGNEALKAIHFQNQLLSDKSLENVNALFVLCFTYSAPNMTDLMVRLLDDDRSGNDPNEMPGDLNSLHTLCQNYRGDHFKDIVDLLIEHKIDLNAKTKTGGWNALHILCHFSNANNLKPLVEHLIKRGIDPAVRTERPSSRTALHLVCQSFRGDDLKQVMQLLISKKNATNPSAMSILCRFYNGDDLQDLLQLIINHVEDANETHENGWNALHVLCACYKGRHLKDLVQFLLTNGIRVNAITENEGATALHLLCLFYNGADLKDVIEIFMKYGADLGKAVPGFGDALFLILTKNYSQTNLREIVDLLYDNNGVRHYYRKTLHYLCFFYRGAASLFDIVKRIVESAPTLEQYHPAKLIEDMEEAHGHLTLFNQDLWNDDRKKVKKYLEDAIYIGSSFYIWLNVIQFGST